MALNTIIDEAEKAFPPEVLAIDARYFHKHVQHLPVHYTSIDTSRMSVAYFCLGALDILGILHTLTTEEERAGWIEWIYAQQIHPQTIDKAGAPSPHCGFRGGPFAGAPYSSHSSIPCNDFDSAHITMTYTALACLIILGDDLSRVNRDAITASLRQLQQENGSFCPNWGSDECDMRFLYCACTISFMLNDWRGVDVDRALAFIRNSQTYEYAFGQGPGQEAHGGSTYCAVASLSLMNRLDELKGRDQLIYWLLTRQVDGFNGRPNKPTDTCYSFWIGASLDLLGVYHLVDTDTLKKFLKSTHTKYGGFGKGPGDYPDLLHSYMGLSGLAITKGVPGLAELHTGLGLTARSMKHLNEKTVLSNTRAM